MVVMRRAVVMDPVAENPDLVRVADEKAAHRVVLDLIAVDLA